MKPILRLVLFFVTSWFPSVVVDAVVGEDVLPEAQWISSDPPEEERGAAFFRKSFTVPPGVVKAVLLAACDERMNVWANGEKAAEVAGFERAVTLDLTRHVRPGQNLLAVRVDNDRHLPAFRLILELATDRGRQSWVVSDASWLCSRAQSDGWEEARFEALSWRPAFAHGEAGLKRWRSVFHATKTPDVYNSWMLASGTGRATDPAAITAPAGFRVELLRSAQPGEGSWIALAFDPRGRLTIAREQRGLLRFTLGTEAVEKVEVIDDTLLECRGLLYAHGSLYVNANNSKGFYRLRDTDGDDQFDEKKLLLQTTGGVGHGRNHIVLGPDGLLYLVHGNDVELPANFAADSPLAHFAPDQLFPERWGEQGSSDYVRPPHGHILQTDSDGKTWRLIAGGLRNPLDVAFNADGEMFTYEADNERDIAAPWYRPTRVLHLIPGGDYGWRPGAGKWPTYLPDTLPSALDIGVGSPCGIEFGTGSRFPPPLQRALFIADWAYGRILAVHLQPSGGSYRGNSETFVTGRPLNVTDLAFGPDGAMYFVTGGRGTQSGLYRVRFIGASGPPDESPREAATPELLLRRSIESLHTRPTADALPTIWRELGHADHWIRAAARIALEERPLHDWQEKAFAERDVSTALTALLALSRVASREVQPRLLTRLMALPLAELDNEQKLRAVRVFTVICARMGPPSREAAEGMVRNLEPIYPATGSWPLNHELCRLLVYLRAPSAVAKTTALLAAASTPEDLLHYLWHLRRLGDGWTVDQRRIVFEALRRAEQHQGARDFLQALRDSRQEFTAALSPVERAALGEIIQPVAAGLSPGAAVDPLKYRFTQAWTLADFPPEELARQGSAESGREAFTAAQCAHCHRVGRDAGGFVGPDLTDVGARYGRRDLLEQIIEPSKVIDDKFRNISITLRDGATYVGAVEREDERELSLLIGLNADDVIAVRKSEIAARAPSAESPMPAGLLNILNRQQIADLLTYLQSTRR